MYTYFKIKLYEKLASYAPILIIIGIAFVVTVISKIIQNYNKRQEKMSEEHWDEVADYCCNDVLATEATFDHLSADWTARNRAEHVAEAADKDTP